MLKKLRIKFIALNMATVALVLAVVFTSICFINYQQSLQDVNAALDSAIARAGDGTQHNPLTPNDQGMPPEIGGKHKGSDQIIPVAVYSIQADGTLKAASSTATASISDEVLADAANALTSNGDSTGTLDALSLYYEKHTMGDVVYLAFADMSATAGWQSLALTLTAVGAVALVVFFVISVFFSRWALRPVTQAWIQQRRFVADASHDLKTPLTVILANASILLEHPERSVASQSQWVESTQHEAESMQELVSDLLLLAQLDEASTKPVFHTLDLTDLVESELLQFESVAFECDVQLDSHLDEGIAIQGDTARLRRLVATLLDNACKYVDKRGQVTVDLRQTVRAIELSVHNTGPAIPAEDLPHVFDRFYRADKARTRDDSSYGLGLAIARAIAEEHGGMLVAISDDERGTTFVVTLPLNLV